jgi:hypothetical protein
MARASGGCGIIASSRRPCSEQGTLTNQRHNYPFDLFQVVMFAGNAACSGRMPPVQQAGAGKDGIGQAQCATTCCSRLSSSQVNHIWKPLAMAARASAFARSAADADTCDQGTLDFNLGCGVSAGEAQS